MTREKLEARLAALQTGALSLQANIAELKVLLETRQNDLHATNGAAKECQFWIAALDAESPAKVSRIA